MEDYRHHWNNEDGTFSTQSWFTGEIITWKVEPDENGSVTITRNSEAQPTATNNNIFYEA